MKVNELREHPYDPLAALCQVNDGQAREGQPDIYMNGVADVEKLQRPQCCRRKGKQGKMHEQSRPGAPRGA